jgi:hypothetical protein
LALFAYLPALRSRAWNCNYRCHVCTYVRRNC